MKKYFFYFIILLSTLTSCKKENDNSRFISINNAYPIAVGKTFLYRLDSTVPVDFGKSLEVHSYLAKDSIESSYIDPTGKTAFRIYRYITDTLFSKPWQFCATHTATLTANSIEYTENNLRYIKLVNPISYNTSWKGNLYINTTLGVSQYYYLDDWNYHYENIEEPFTCIKQTFDTTYTVLQNDEQTPANFDPTVYNEKKYGKEIYAKGVGLIYKEFLFYIWQTTPKPAYQDDSYGIKLNLIDYK